MYCDACAHAFASDMDLVLDSYVYYVIVFYS